MRATTIAFRSFLTRCIDWRKDNRADCPISYLGTPMKTGDGNIETIMLKRRILLSRFGVRMEDTRLPKRVMFGELVGSAGCVGGKPK